VYSIRKQLAPDPALTSWDLDRTLIISVGNTRCVLWVCCSHCVSLFEFGNKSTVSETTQCNIVEAI